jgi:hypothetical protein
LLSRDRERSKARNNGNNPYENLSGIHGNPPLHSLSDLEE